jgi:hypothetical protein
MNKKFDHTIIGLLLGIAVPFLVLAVFFFFKYSHMTVDRFFYMIRLEDTLSPRISLCVIANLFVFYSFIWTHRYKSARGVILATFIYAAFIVYLKFFA